MTIAPQRSTMFSDVDYDESSRTLTVTFRRGGDTISYQDVPPRVAEQFMASGSMGTFWHANIKGQYV